MHIRDLEAELGIKLELHGSVFLPSKKLLAQQRFRPWRGVFLDQQAWSSPPEPRHVLYSQCDDVVRVSLSSSSLLGCVIC